MSPFLSNCHGQRMSPIPVVVMGASSLEDPQGACRFTERRGPVWSYGKFKGPLFCWASEVWEWLGFVES